jgi:hypothetical protein
VTRATAISGAAPYIHGKFPPRVELVVEEAVELVDVAVAPFVVEVAVVANDTTLTDPEL